MFATTGVQRSFGFAACALLLVLGLIHLSSSFPSPQARLHVFDRLRGGSIPYNGTVRPVRITKVSALVGERNHLYEAALKTHEQHNELHGYEMRVLRERIANTYVAKPTYLISLMVEELAKPVDQRVEWLVWFDPDTIVLNPQIPLEMFVPPADQKGINLVVTHDDNNGLSSGVLFMRVSQWMLKLLIEVLAVPLQNDKHELAISKDSPALEKILADPFYRGKTVYQPRNWFNAHHVNGTFEGQRGDMVVHFTDVNGDKWTAMDDYLGNVTEHNNPWEMELHQTAYEPMVNDYWRRIRQAQALLTESEEKIYKLQAQVHVAAENLRHALDYNTDHFEVVIAALIGLTRAMREQRQSE